VPGHIANQAPGGFDAHGFDRVIQHWGQQFCQFFRSWWLDVGHRCPPDQGFFIHQGNFHRLQCFFTGVSSQHGKRSGPHIDWIERIAGQVDQAFSGIGIPVTGPGNHRAVV